MAAGGTVMLRKMKDVHFVVVAAYVNIGIVVVYGLMMAIQRVHFNLFCEFETIDIMLLALAGLLTAFGTSLRSLSYQYDTASRLSILKYFDNVIQLLCDLLIFNTELSVY